ncbi:hypothetical protein D9F08_19025 [Escherichia coli]|nr:hypothetical protein [Escherichia coli]
MNPAIKTAINIVGSQKKLGAACEVSQQAVYKWLHNKAKVLVLIRTRLRLAHMDTPSPLTLLVTRKTPSKTSHLTIL